MTGDLGCNCSWSVFILTVLFLNANGALSRQMLLKRIGKFFE